MIRFRGNTGYNYCWTSMDLFYLYFIDSILAYGILYMENKNQFTFLHKESAFVNSGIDL